MTSEAKVAANRQNAQFSTGPRSAEGRRASSRNSQRHGLLAKEALLGDEDAAEFRALQDRMYEDLSPVGAVEELLVDRITSLAWRLRRVMRVESGLLEYRRLEQDAAIAEARVKSYTKTRWDTISEKLAKDDVEIVDAEKHRSARSVSLDAQSRLLEPIPSLGRWFVADQASLALLSRYEAGFERSFFKALHELQRIQARRQGEAVPYPAAVDVELGFAPQLAGPSEAGTE